MRLTTIFLGLSLVANVIALSVVFQRLRGLPTQAERGQDAMDFRLFDDRMSRFSQLPAAPCDVLVLGDSIPQLMILDLEDRSWQGDLPTAWAPILKGRIANRCIPSVTAIGLKKMVDSTKLPQAKNVFIWVGINDLLLRRNIGDVEADDEQILAQVRRGDPDARITFISVLPTRDGAFVNASERAFNQELAALAEKTGSRFIDVRPAVSTTAGFLDARFVNLDGVHPNFAGLARIEDELQLATPAPF